eukprot:CAMPEP_0118703568 /NCGR_PEP_ID=MMETSP0800-20121206/18644_1 /TAXON_ID=210618 ORGANISM="Striatella unipunctata, Strain CCMP2910" /NCGR_SAMPLE_ID=MMETSP0800 /ASSEMBLY_ACC=CAM_ASM_000638 /LENGTH=273 /DNA_ID=CAMNT_0006605145 /DNA_START=12 /DNA_END=833 /DNA_ORIENTATION=+
MVAAISAVGILWIHEYGLEQEEQKPTSRFEKITVALKVLVENPKMKYMIGLNALFGFAAAFLNSYVNGEVVYSVLGSDDKVGSLNALTAASAAVSSLAFGKLAQYTGKGPVLMMGAVAFSWVGGAFLLRPNVANDWNIVWLVSVYVFQGIGRSTFEGTLRSTFADYFPKETVGAFANITLQNGMAATVGYYLSNSLKCSDEGIRGCTKFRNGTLHNVLAFEWLVVLTAVFAILGYWRASVLQNREEKDGEILGVASPGLLADEEEEEEVRRII